MEFAAARIVEYFQQNPAEDSYSLGVNDNLGFSEDEIDRNTLGFFGHPTATPAYYKFVNSVAEAVTSVLPGKQFGVLAYTSVSDPPNFSLHSSIVPYLTHDLFGWPSEEWRERHQAWVRNWSAVTSQFGIYDYAYGHTYQAPRIYLQTMQEAYRWSANVGAKYQISELYPNWGEGPKPWVYSRLLWNPDRDVETLTQEWCIRSVGDAAAPDLIQYYKVWEEIWNTRIIGSEWLDSTIDNEMFAFTNSAYLAEILNTDLAQLRTLIDSVESASSTIPQQRRAVLLRQTFDYYEASARSYPVQKSSPTTGQAALELLQETADGLDQAVGSAQRRKKLLAQFANHPVLRQQSQPGTTNQWSGWNVYPLFLLADYIREGREGADAVRARTQSMATAGSSTIVRA